MCYRVSEIHTIPIVISIDLATPRHAVLDGDRSTCGGMKVSEVKKKFRQRSVNTGVNGAC